MYARLCLKLIFENYFPLKIETTRFIRKKSTHKTRICEPLDKYEATHTFWGVNIYINPEKKQNIDTSVLLYAFADLKQREFDT